jgi:hypothetical protein
MGLCRGAVTRRRNAGSFWIQACVWHQYYLLVDVRTSVRLEWVSTGNRGVLYTLGPATAFGPCAVTRLPGQRPHRCGLVSHGGAWPGIEDFERSGEQTRIHLEGNALIESDLAAKTLRIALDGVDVLRDDTLFCPLGETRITCYSITPQTITVPLPAAWNADKVVAVALYPDRREKTAIQQRSGKVRLSLESRRPVMLYRDSATAGLNE